MLHERTAAAVTERPPMPRTAPEAMRMIADRLETLPGLPHLAVTVHETGITPPDVDVQVSFRNRPQEKFPTVARLLAAFGGRSVTAKVMPYGRLHYHGAAFWQGMRIVVFAVTSPCDAGRE